jgi:hypothetical protein
MTRGRIGALLEWFQSMIYKPPNLCLFYHLLHKHDLYVMEYKAVFQYDLKVKHSRYRPGVAQRIPGS